MWLNLEDIWLNEISQSQKDKCGVIPLMSSSRLVKSTETESRRVLAKGWLEGEQGVGVLLEFVFGKMKVLEMNGGDAVIGMYLISPDTGGG